MKSRMIGSILCGAAAAVMLTACGRVDINAADYVTFDFEGYDSFGTASARVDFDKMMSDNPEAFGLEDDNELDKAAVEMRLEETLKGELDKKDSLKNGDTVTFKWDDINTEKLEKNYKVKFIFDDKSGKVEGLSAAEDYDPFGSVTLKYSGFDGKGSAYIDNYGDGLVSVKLDDSANGTLKNGDKVKVKVNGSADELKESLLRSGKNLTATEKEYTVDGLEAYKDVDLFDYLSVTYTGTSPNGKAEIKQTDGSPVSYINYNADKTSGLANGDVIKLTIEGDYESSGIKVAATEKEYTVEGLPYYISALEELPADVSEKMQKNDRDIFEARVASNWGEKEKFKDMKLVGNYFIKPKEGVDVSWGTVNNRVYFVYEISASNDKDGNFKYYWASSYYDIVILADGTCSFDLTQASYTSTVNNNYKPGDRYYYNGFGDLDSLFSKLITANIDKYEYENTVGAADSKKPEEKKEDKDDKDDKDSKKDKDDSEEMVP